MGIVAKNDGNFAALASGGRIVRMGSGPSLDRFQAQAIWEMSVIAIRNSNRAPTDDDQSEVLIHQRVDRGHQYVA